MKKMYPARVASLASRMIYIPVNIWQRDILAAQGQPDLFPDEFEILVFHNNNLEFYFSKQKL